MKSSPKGKTVVVIDAGGRGSALIHAYSKSPHVTKLIAIPGNDFMGINTKKTVQTFPHLKTTSIPEIIKICKDEHADLVDVAQDNAVESGVVDALLKEGFKVLGPTKLAGQIEWDKAWAREFMKRHNLPSPLYIACHSEQQGIDFIKSHPNGRWFVKAAGLAEGKGAIPAENDEEALNAIKEMSRFGAAGETYVIEEWLEGEEFSYFALTDGKTIIQLGAAQDHKRVNEGDLGENTGGMGCSTPPLVLTKDLEKQAQIIITKTIHGLSLEGRPYKGVLYLGGIVTNNNVKIIEFNARWGDPEVEVLAPGIKTDFYEIGNAIATDTLSKISIKKDNLYRVAVAGCSKGYPSNYSAIKGKEIKGIESAMKLDGIIIYPAGIKKSGKQYIAHGGRLFYVVGKGSNVNDARKNAYDALKRISIEGDNLHYRKDIGYRDINRMTS